MGSKIDKETEALGSQRNLGRLAKSADRAAAGNLDQARIREIVLETVDLVTGKRNASPTVSEWLERWIQTEKGAVAPRTMMRRPARHLDACKN